MSNTLPCEVCHGEHRVIAWRTPAGGSMRLCVLCRHALKALAEWQGARPDSPLDSLIAQLPAYLPQLGPAVAHDEEKVA